MSCVIFYDWTFLVEICVVLGAFSVIVKLSTSRRIVSSSSPYDRSSRLSPHSHCQVHIDPGRARAAPPPRGMFSLICDHSLLPCSGFLHKYLFHLKIYTQIFFVCCIKYFCTNQTSGLKYSEKVCAAIIPPSSLLL